VWETERAASFGARPQQLSTGAYEIVYKDNSGKNFSSEVIGWKQFVDEVIAENADKPPF